MEQLSAITSFIARWQASGASERANYVSFLNELCDQINVARPNPTQADDTKNVYVFERNVTFHNADGSTSVGRIDLYKRACFVLEAKQGSERVSSESQVLGFGLFPELETQNPKRRKGTAVRGTKGWDEAMLKARGQAERYAKELPASEGWPPFLVIVDVGYSIELYADFTRSGKTYLPFPDARSHRIQMADLARPEIRSRLRLVWDDPIALDPSRRSALVTREVANKLAALAKSFEASGHAPNTVSHFLMRCLFTMFAEDVKLIPNGKFTELLESLRDEVQIFPEMISSLWRTMNDGGFSPILKSHVLKFNGGLFADCTALPISKAQLELLIEAGKSDWREVEPAIFGTLLERALDPIERHKLGAHYTPRAYVERLVMPTIIDPLREEWNAVKAAAVTLARADKLDDAIAEVKNFHRRLCDLRVLDPACGSGNFLYVTLEHLKRLEGEVIAALDDFGERQGFFEIEEFTVDPHQLLGIEINPRAAAIADLVLWIGYLQWHFRTRGEALPREPVLKKFRNIECRDAVLAYDAKEIVKDETGQAVTRWDGRTYKKHAVTGEDVPDESARVPLFAYTNARPAEWPAADYIIGNPPFIGTARMRATLGDGYTETLRKIYGEIGESSDYVMYWWDKAAQLTRDGKIHRFGLITTNSLRQTFNRRVMQNHLAAKNPLSLLFAIPDHPWIDAADAAAVRIAMTVAAAGEYEGVLQKVEREFAPEASLGAQASRLPSERSDAPHLVSERTKDQTNSLPGEGAALHALRAGETPALPASDDSVTVELSTQRGKIFADLTIGADVAGAQPLQANENLSNRGMMLFGAGFIITPEEAKQIGLGKIEGLEKHIRHYRNGRDLTSNSRNVMVIDLFGLTTDEVRAKFPEVFQWIYERVKPERDQNRDDAIRLNWWLYGRPRPELRDALHGLFRFIATVETSKHRFFVFLDQTILPDNMLVNIALTDAFYLGVLSSCFHIVWALAAGGTLEDRPRYNKTRCFEPFPFPDCNEIQKEIIRALGEQLDAHRKRQQALHPALTMTDMYNVLEKLRAAASLSDKEKIIHEHGLVSVLKQLHDELDAAVADAYGWPVNLSDEEILARLVTLNAERAEEEKRGLIRWLRPAYQNPAGASQSGFDMGVAPTEVGKQTKREKLVWPKSLAEQARAVQSALASAGDILTAADLAKNFKPARVDRVEELLQTLVSLGQARDVGAGKYSV